MHGASPRPLILRTLCGCPGRVATPAARAGEARLPTRPPLPGLSGPSSRPSLRPELQGAEPWPRGPDRSRADVAGQIPQRERSALRGHRQRPEVGPSGLVQTDTGHHVAAPGDGPAPGQRPSGKCPQECGGRLVPGQEEAPLQRGPQPQASAQPGPRGSRGWPGCAGRELLSATPTLAPPEQPQGGLSSAVLRGPWAVPEGQRSAVLPCPGCGATPSALRSPRPDMGSPPL